MGGASEVVNLVSCESRLRVELLYPPRLDLSGGVREKTHGARLTVQPLHWDGVVDPGDREIKTLYSWKFSIREIFAEGMFNIEN